MQVIEGNNFMDSRGIVKFINNFEMSQVVRMYAIYPNKKIIRAWQGHQKEIKWFFVAKGEIMVKTRNMKTNKVQQFLLTEDEPKVLKIPGGNYNGFQALQADSILMVYSNNSIEESLQDDYRQTIEEFPW